MLAFENKLELFIVDIETGCLLHYEKLREFKDTCTASDPAQHFDLQMLVDFTTSFLQSFKACLREFHVHTPLFRFITCPHKCAVDNVDLLHPWCLYQKF